MENTGIDYGRGLSNIDLDTGIRYGVIQANHIGQAWYDDSEAVYPPRENDEDGDEDFDSEPTHYYYEDGSYVAEQSYDDPDIFITKSPYYTLCNFCSPCAPGAGYIESENEQGIKAYCFGHDWFDEGKAPYTVYDVKTNKIVEV